MGAAALATGAGLAAPVVVPARTAVPEVLAPQVMLTGWLRIAHWLIAGAATRFLQTKQKVDLKTDESQDPNDK